MIAVGMTFVAMSRCPDHKNICNQPFAFDRVSHLFEQKGLAPRRIEQARQVAVAEATENAWRAANHEQIVEWAPQLLEQRRLRDLNVR